MRLLDFLSTTCFLIVLSEIDGHLYCPHAQPQDQNQVYVVLWGIPFEQFAYFFSSVFYSGESHLTLICSMIILSVEKSKYEKFRLFIRVYTHDIQIRFFWFVTNKPLAMKAGNLSLDFQNQNNSNIYLEYKHGISVSLCLIS